MACSTVWKKLKHSVKLSAALFDLLMWSLNLDLDSWLLFPTSLPPLPLPPPISSAIFSAITSSRRMLPWKGKGLYLQPTISSFVFWGCSGVQVRAPCCTQMRSYALEGLRQGRGPTYCFFPLHLSQLWDWPAGRIALSLMDPKCLQQPFKAPSLVYFNLGPASQGAGLEETQMGVFFPWGFLSCFSVLKHDGSSLSLFSQGWPLLLQLMAMEHGDSQLVTLKQALPSPCKTPSAPSHDFTRPWLLPFCCTFPAAATGTGGGWQSCRQSSPQRQATSETCQSANHSLCRTRSEQTPRSSSSHSCQTPYWIPLYPNCSCLGQPRPLKLQCPRTPLSCTETLPIFKQTSSYLHSINWILNNIKNTA